MSRITIRDNKKKCEYDYRVRYSRGEIILTMSEDTGRCGTLLKGRAHISAVDETGTDTVLEYLTEGSSFSEYYTLLPKNMSGFVVADTDCTVRFINMARVLGGCAGSCDLHEEVMKDLVLMSASHSREQSLRLSILSRRTLREKILAYLSYQQQYAPDTEEFTIPLSLAALAEYLCADRCALMREIRKMNDEGIIESKGRTFTFLREENRT